MDLKTDLKIVLYPDARLLIPTAPVTAITPEIRARVAQMFQLMYGQKGVGLAAPQVGWSVRLLVLNPSGDAAHPEQQRVVINPRILRREGRERGEEGCLSFPGIYVEVERARSITLESMNLDGETLTEPLAELPARIVQHEMDHLENILLIHRMSAADRVRHRAALEELAAAAVPSPAR